MLTQSYPSTAHVNLEQNAHLPAWAYTLLAILIGLVGLAASAVTADFFIIGLLKLEADALARDALIAAGVLMIVAEVLAFSVAALLPRARLASLRRRLTVFGMALLASRESPSMQRRSHWRRQLRLVHRPQLLVSSTCARQLTVSGHRQQLCVQMPSGRVRANIRGCVLTEPRAFVKR
ncbi:hypothetical protein AU476_01310 [Cupriavidus sp. UYMSc13B]|nr:hypothetical protein AU476_01310 [Cupriavidus sp. UYMSc13B]